jgi:hypothetical protein
MLTARRTRAGRDATSRPGADAGGGANVDGEDEAAVAAASPWFELLP